MTHVETVMTGGKKKKLERLTRGEDEIEPSNNPRDLLARAQTT